MASCVRFLEHRMTPWGFHVIFTNLFFLLRPIDGPKSFRIPPTWSPRAAHLARVLRLAGMTTEESSAPRINSAIMSHGGGNQPRHVSPLTVEVRGPPPSPGTHMKFPFRCHKRLYGRIHCVHGIVPMVGTWNLQSFDGSVWVAVKNTRGPCESREEDRKILGQFWRLVVWPHVDPRNWIFWLGYGKIL